MKNRMTRSMGGSQSWESLTMAALTLSSQGKSRTPGRGCIIMLPLLHEETREVGGKPHTSTKILMDENGQPTMKACYASDLLKMDRDDPVRRWYDHNSRRAGQTPNVISEKGKSRKQVANIRLDVSVIDEAQRLADETYLIELTDLVMKGDIEVSNGQ